MLYVLLIVLGNCIPFSIETTATSSGTDTTTTPSATYKLVSKTTLNNNYGSDSVKLRNEENIKITFPLSTIGTTTTTTDVPSTSSSSASTPMTTLFKISTVGIHFLSITEMIGNTTTKTTAIPPSPSSTIQSSLPIIEIDDGNNNNNDDISDNSNLTEIYRNLTIPNTILDYDQLNSIKIENFNHTDGIYENYDELATSPDSIDNFFNQTISKRYRLKPTTMVYSSISVPNRNLSYSMLLPPQVTTASPTDSSWPVRHSSVVEGDVIIGGLMMIHEREDTITCGPIMPQGGIQALEAMLYTLDRINDLNLLPNITLGAHILDDCDKDTYGLEMAVDFIKGKLYF